MVAVRGVDLFRSQFCFAYNELLLIVTVDFLMRNVKTEIFGL